MKKLLSILAAVGMTATAGIAVVACSDKGGTQDNEDSYQKLFDKTFEVKLDSFNATKNPWGENTLGALYASLWSVNDKPANDDGYNTPNSEIKDILTKGESITRGADDGKNITVDGKAIKLDEGQTDWHFNKVTENHEIKFKVDILDYKKGSKGKEYTTHKDVVITIKTLKAEIQPPIGIKVNISDILVDGVTIGQPMGGLENSINSAINHRLDADGIGGKAIKDTDYTITGNTDTKGEIKVESVDTSTLITGNFNISVDEKQPTKIEINNVKIDKITTNEQLKNIDSIIQKGIKDQVGVEVDKPDYTFTQGYQVGLTGQTITVNASEDSKLIFGSFTIEVAETHPSTPIEPTIQEKFTKNIQYLNDNSLLNFEVKIKTGQEDKTDYASPIQSQLKDIFEKHSQELPNPDVTLDGVTGIYTNELPHGSEQEKNGGLWLSPEYATMFFTVGGQELKLACNYSINITKYSDSSDLTPAKVNLKIDDSAITISNFGTVNRQIENFDLVNHFGFKLDLTNKQTVTKVNVSLDKNTKSLIVDAPKIETSMSGTITLFGDNIDSITIKLNLINQSQSKIDIDTNKQTIEVIKDTNGGAIEINNFKDLENIHLSEVADPTIATAELEYGDHHQIWVKGLKEGTTTVTLKADNANDLTITINVKEKIWNGDDITNAQVKWDLTAYKSNIKDMNQDHTIWIPTTKDEFLENGLTDEQWSLLVWTGMLNTENPILATIEFGQKHLENFLHFSKDANKILMDYFKDESLIPNKNGKYQLKTETANKLEMTLDVDTLSHTGKGVNMQSLGLIASSTNFEDLAIKFTDTKAPQPIDSKIYQDAIHYAFTSGQETSTKRNEGYMTNSEGTQLTYNDFFAIPNHPNTQDKNLLEDRLYIPAVDYIAGKLGVDKTDTNKLAEIHQEILHWSQTNVSLVFAYDKGHGNGQEVAITYNGTDDGNTTLAQMYIDAKNKLGLTEADHPTMAIYANGFGLIQMSS